MVDILDPAQFNRIEATHRGFLYQHLYAVGCLLLASQSGVLSLFSERDEDIEIHLPDYYDYVQVKSRQNPLIFSDIDGALENFKKLRELHINGQRITTPRFWIVTNSTPAPSLLSKLTDLTWPTDVILLWPESTFSPPVHLPIPWKNIPSAVEWCTAIANTIPYSQVSGDTLTWKLAALISYVSTGTTPREEHQIDIASLPKLFEQVLIQFQEFPKSPESYRPHEHEPPYDVDSNIRVRLITGLSGAGKTAWAGQLALHTGAEVAYYAIQDGIATASGLTRELAARFFNQHPDDIRSALMPGISGLEGLRMVDLGLSRAGKQVIVVMDNVDLADPAEISKIVTTTSTLRFILLTHPGSNQRQLVSRLNLQSEQLEGWSLDAIGAECARFEAHVSPQTAQKIKQITGGLPLYVRSLIDVALSSYAGNVDQACNAIDSQTHLERTTQEYILKHVADALSTPAQQGLAILSIATVPLLQSEATSIIMHTLALTDQAVSRILRDLIDYGILQRRNNQTISIHDAFRVIGIDILESMGQENLRKSKLFLKETLKSSQLSNPKRVGLYIKLLIETQDIETFIDISGIEQLHQQGHFSAMKAGLEYIASSDEFSANHRFWAMDTLSRALLEVNNFQQAEIYLNEMENLLPHTKNEISEQVSILTKRMFISIKQDKPLVIKDYYEKISHQLEENSEIKRVFWYNYTLMLDLQGFHKQAEKEAFAIVLDYFKILELNITQILFKNANEIEPLLEGKSIDDIKRMGDALKLLAHTVVMQDKNPGLATLHAVKFYDLARSPVSLVKFGQDVVNEFINILKDPKLALDFLEKTLIPTMENYQLMEYIVPVRTQYAVVLAYCGRNVEALKQIESIRVFYPSLLPEQQTEFDNQVELINQINDGAVMLPNASNPLPIIDQLASQRLLTNLSSRQDSIQYNQSNHEIILRDCIYQSIKSGEVCDVLTKLGQRYLDVRIDHDVIVSGMYGLRLIDSLPNEIRIISENGIIIPLQTRKVKMVVPFLKGKATDEELQAVDISEGNKLTSNGLTMREMITNVYSCKNKTEVNYFLRRWLAS